MPLVYDNGIYSDYSKLIDEALYHELMLSGV